MVTKNEEVCQRRGNRRERKMIYIDQLFVQKMFGKIRECDKRKNKPERQSNYSTGNQSKDLNLCLQSTEPRFRKHQRPLFGVSEPVYRRWPEVKKSGRRYKTGNSEKNGLLFFQNFPSTWHQKNISFLVGS